MARAKRISISIIKVNKLFSFFSSGCFLKGIESTYSVFVSSYRNTRESLGAREKLWKHNPTVPIATAVDEFPQFLRVSIELHANHLL